VGYLNDMYKKEPKRESVNGGGLPQRSLERTEVGHQPRATTMLYVEHGRHGNAVQEGVFETS